ncbi:MAG TPA: bifunctional oligoribonuclease/PAP phosphatase NrnA [Solirubrobacteraceae bacterium]|nr:bifunctional oligoribonuclease/PAP phosphatase NrnA [Solirubrobacteraceae bacterium]
MTPALGIDLARGQVLDALRGSGRFLLVTHEHPDGDALGSLIGLHGVLTALGKDAAMFLAADELPLPSEYRFLALGPTVSEPPADLAERVIVFLDCGNVDRTPSGEARRDGALVLNIDHHHDNTLFGDVDLVVPEASCTAEIVWELMGELGVAPTPEVAEALYVGLVTDTGKFMYENTTPRAHAMAADLIAAGVDVHAVYRHLYEGIPAAKLRLLGRALERMDRYDDGGLTIVVIDGSDFDAAGATEEHTEGIVDHLRAVEGTRVAALARERCEPGGEGRMKVSLRSADGLVDVSAIARAAGGGGHRQAAGFTTEMSADELVAFLREQIDAQS